MWHVETDYFALAVFLIMLIKKFSVCRERKEKQKQVAKRYIQRDSFYFVLIFSVSIIINAVFSTAMNSVNNWRAYRIAMTMYVVSMTFFAA